MHQLAGQLGTKRRQTRMGPLIELSSRWALAEITVLHVSLLGCDLRKWPYRTLLSLHIGSIAPEFYVFASDETALQKVLPEEEHAPLIDASENWLVAPPERLHTA